MFAVVSRFAVANNMTNDVKAAFINRPHLVDKAPGFVRLDVLSPRESSDEIWLITYWDNEESFNTWHGSHAFKESHCLMPKGLKLVTQDTKIRYFDHVAT